MFTIQQTYCCFQLFIGGHYLELMESRVKRVKESKNEIERSQNWLLRSIYRLMRQIALLQVCNAALWLYVMFFPHENELIVLAELNRIL